MDDRQVEDLLKRYRPAGPPESLRARCLMPPATRVWPWASAAAALVAITVGLEVATANAMAGAELAMTPDPSAAAIADLAQVLGGDEAAMRAAEQIIEQEMRRDRELAARSAPPTGDVP